MSKHDNGKAVEESIEEITQLEETGKAEVIADARDERLGDHRPVKHRIFDFFKSGPGRLLVVFLLITGVALVVPMTRYALMGVFIKKQTVITVLDDVSGKPVSDALVRYGRVDAKTDSKGAAKIDNVSVGDHMLAVEKKFYTTSETSYVVPIFSDAKTTVKLKATGRVATLMVTNAVSGKPLAGAGIKVGDATATTDDAGAASIALAISDTIQPGQVSAEGYRPVDVTVNTKDIAPSIEAKLVPEGKVYFLSNRTGSYDVMGSTLDGVDQQVLVKGTGKELAYELQLLSSPNRSHLAFNVRRDGDDAANIYMVNTANGELKKLETSTGAMPLGWIKDTFYFDHSPYEYGTMKDKRSQLFGYNATTKQQTVVDSSQLEGDQLNYAELQPAGYQLVGDRIYYAKCWNYSMYYGGVQERKASLMAVVDGKATVLKEVPQSGQAYCDTVATKPGIIYYRVNFSMENRSDSYRYQLGKAVESVQVNDGELYNNFYTYLASPNGEKTYWTETRDGKKVSFIGDANGQNEQQVGAADYEAYGWFGNDYVLYSKNGSELYVAALGSQLDGAHKVADYFSQQRGPGY